MKGSVRQSIRLFDVQRMLSKWCKGIQQHSNKALHWCYSKRSAFSSAIFSNSRNDNVYITTIHGDGTANYNYFQEGVPTTCVEGIDPDGECYAVENESHTATLNMGVRTVCRMSLWR
uniref:Uncharacterized protein n=1 Tax=Spironucleus salmonicida TaxID=348837 RepID=V6LEG3_9EUKA|eukprot:EST42653.1 Hypothetical protein SS50377_17761 [Spironucleus salmonicida]